MDKTTLGDRMKSYEKLETQQKFIPTLPIVIRIDGRAFSKFTKPFKRPYDKDLTDVMIETTKSLVDQSNAVIGYTQSDEISLILFSEDIKSQVFFNGRKDKLLSVLSGIATSTFMFHAMQKWPEYIQKLATANRLPSFDCRAFNVPNRLEAVNALVWREQDATKNAIQMLGQDNFSHKSLQGLSGNLIQKKLLEKKDINFNDEPYFFKRGTYVRKKTRTIFVNESNVAGITDSEIGQQQLLEKGFVKRSFLEAFDFEQLTKIQNKVEVIFEQADPVFYKEEE
tara:strand:- start:17588 stop:18433 length:846 start_codon:yes stop_codon:yes gene_type:complete